MTKPRLSAMILAGGYSRRMGEDKALIAVEGKPLLQRTCELAQAITSQVYIITPWRERYQDIIPDGCQMIKDESPPQGPLVGLYQGLQQVDTEWVLALACDLPKLTQSELEFWCKQLNTIGKHQVALLPKSPPIWQPLAGFYHQRCQALFAAYLATGRRSFQEFLEQHPVGELEIIDRSTLFNCNTPEDLAQLNK